MLTPYTQKKLQIGVGIIIYQHIHCHHVRHVLAIWSFLATSEHNGQCNIINKNKTLAIYIVVQKSCTKQLNRSDVITKLTQRYVFSISFIFLVNCACKKSQSCGGAMTLAIPLLNNPTGVTPSFMYETSLDYIIKLIQKILKELQ